MSESLFLIKLKAAPTTLFKKSLWHRCFPVNFAKFSKNTLSYRTPPVAASAYSIRQLKHSPVEVLM